MLMLDTSGAAFTSGAIAPRVGPPPAGDPGCRYGAVVPVPGPDPLCDPLLRLGHHPHRGRSHRQKPGPRPEPELSAQKWACVERELWLRAADEAMDKEFDGDYEIWGATWTRRRWNWPGATRSWPRWMTS